MTQFWFRLTASAGIFAGIAAWTMLRLLAQPSAAVPGVGFGDNVTGLWNLWWFGHALEQGHGLYRTSLLFAPFGTQLSLHTHATTHSLLAWPLAALTSVPAGHNLAILIGLTLNGVCTWALAFRATSRFFPSIIAGVIFSWSAYLQLHLLGHINLVHAWVLPLSALAVMRFSSRPTAASAAAMGTAAALVVYTDYYFAVYAGVLVVTWLVVHGASTSVIRTPPRLPRVRMILLALLVVDALVIATIAITGGTTVNLGVATALLRGLRNPLTVFWLVLVAWLLSRYPLKLSIRWGSARSSPRVRGFAAVAVLMCVLLTTPLWLALWNVVAAGEYTTQKVFWRSSPAGVDALTLVLGHPLHLLTGTWTSSAYRALGIDVMEQAIWLGVVPLVLIVASRREWLGSGSARVWAVTAVVFAVLALGPFLRIGGFDTALPLPHAVLRYVPVFSNARVPGRAVVMVQLSIAMLTAFALAGRKERSSMTILLGILVAIETLPAPAPAQLIPPRDAVDIALASSPGRAAVAELPLGIRDGFGETGSFDHRALVHQMWHEGPLVGGFVARLSPPVRAGYLQTPLLADLLTASTPSMTEGGLKPGAAADAAALGIGFVVINRDTFIGARLSRQAMADAGFTFTQASGPRELYSTTGR